MPTTESTALRQPVAVAAILLVVMTFVRDANRSAVAVTAPAPIATNALVTNVIPVDSRRSRVRAPDAIPPA